MFKVKFVELTNKFNDTKNRQLANIAAQDKEARTVQTIRHKEQMKNATGVLKKEVAKLKKRIKGALPHLVATCGHLLLLR